MWSMTYIPLLYTVNSTYRRLYRNSVLTTVCCIYRLVPSETFPEGNAKKDGQGGKFSRQSKISTQNLL